MKKSIGLKISVLINIVLCAALFLALMNLNGPDSGTGSIKTTYKIQYNERTSLFENVPTAHADVVFLGDSITQNGLWDELFPDVSLVNRGIRGDTTNGVLKRLDNVVKLQPKKIFLMIGVNDLQYRIDKEKILNNYSKIVETIRAKLPDTKVYVQSILPVVENKRPIKNEDIDYLNTNIKKLTNGENIIFLDINSELKTDNNELDEKYTVDGEHLTGDAYSIWADSIRQYVY